MLALILILLIFSVFVIYLVSKGAVLTAEESLGNYLRAVIGGRTEEAYNYLSSAYKAKRSLPDYKASSSLGHGLIAQVIGGKIAFAVENIEVTGDRSTATVVMTSPDFTSMFHDIFRDVPAAGIPEPALEALTFVCRHISHFVDKYRGEGLPMRTTKETFFLLREGGGWKIDPRTPGDGYQ